MSTLIENPDGTLLELEDRLIENVDNDCCCPECCGCATITDAARLNKNMTVTISGLITGTCTLSPFPDEDELRGVCNTWRNLYAIDAPANCDTDDFGTWNIQWMHFYCPNAASITEYIFETSLSNLGCQVVGSKTPFFIAGYPARNPDVATCNPFYAKFVFPLTNKVPLGCGGATHLTFEVAIE